MNPLQHPVIKRSLAAVKEWNAKFMRNYPPLKPVEKEDGFGNRRSGGYSGGAFQRTIIQPEEAHDLPAPPAVKPVRIAGGIAGALTMAGMTIAGVMLHGTTTPVAMFGGGVMLSLLGAITGAMIAPAVAVITGSFVVGTAALIGVKLPKLPALPKINLPDIQLDKMKSALASVPGQLKNAFQKATKRAASTKPVKPSITPPIP